MTAQRASCLQLGNHHEPDCAAPVRGERALPLVLRVQQPAGTRTNTVTSTNLFAEPRQACPQVARC